MAKDLQVPRPTTFKIWSLISGERKEMKNGQNLDQAVFIMIRSLTFRIHNFS